MSILEGFISILEDLGRSSEKFLKNLILTCIYTCLHSVRFWVCNVDFGVISCVGGIKLYFVLLVYSAIIGLRASCSIATLRILRIRQKKSDFPSQHRRFLDRILCQASEYVKKSDFPQRN